MRWFLVPLVIGVGMAGCAHEVVERPTTAAQMPVDITLAGLDSQPPTHKHMVDASTGVSFWEVRKRGTSKFAIVTYLEAHSDYVFDTRSTRSWIDGILPEDAEVVWHDSGSVREGTSYTEWQAFDLDATTRCLGFLRELKRHSSGAPGSNVQTAIVAMYCRPGMAPLEAAEAEKVSAAIRVRS